MHADFQTSLPFISMAVNHHTSPQEVDIENGDGEDQEHGIEEQGDEDPGGV